MDMDGQRYLLILQEVENNSILTQHSLSQKLCVALSLTNLYLKRLVREGYIKITTYPKNRIRYNLTPPSIERKSRRIYEDLQFSLIYYRNIRH